MGTGGIRTRRRRGSAAARLEREREQQQTDDDDPIVDATSAVAADEFLHQAAALLDQYHAALRPLAPRNPDMVLVRGRAAQEQGNNHGEGELRVPSRNMRPVDEGLAEEEVEEQEEDARAATQETIGRRRRFGGRRRR